MNNEQEKTTNQPTDQPTDQLENKKTMSKQSHPPRPPSSDTPSNNNISNSPSNIISWVTLIKLFCYNHFPKILLIMIAIISFCERDIMSYIFYIMFLVGRTLFNTYATNNR